IRDLEKDHRGSPPVVNQDIYQTVFIEVPGQAAHWSHGGRIEGERRRVEHEGLVAVRGARNRGDGHEVGPRINVADVVRQTIPVEVIERYGGADRGDPAGYSRHIRVHVADGAERGLGSTLWRRQRQTREAESRDDLVALCGRQSGQTGEAVDRQDHHG